MKCREIDEAFAIFELRDDTYRGTDGKLKPIPEPVPDEKLSKAVDATRKKKIRNKAALIQASKINLARTQMTNDEKAMAFILASSKT